MFKENLVNKVVCTNRFAQLEYGYFWFDMFNISKLVETDMILVSSIKIINDLNNCSRSSFKYLSTHTKELRENFWVIYFPAVSDTTGTYRFL